MDPPPCAGEVVNPVRRFTLEDIQVIWNCSKAEIAPECRKKISTGNFRYRFLTPGEQARIIEEITAFIEARARRRTVSENSKAFEVGWEENYRECLAEGVSWRSLKPKYVKPYRTLRGPGGYIAPEDPYLLDRLYTVFILQSAHLYFAAAANIYEFGCGSGQYLYLLAGEYPDKSFTGLDWVDSSMKIVDLIGRERKNVRGCKFDMLHPTPDVVLEPGSGVLTVGALEQLGENYQPFLEYLIDQKPFIVVHHEPIVEFYDVDSVYDTLAKEYHRKRGYLDGYYNALTSLEEQGIVTIVHKRRIPFGDPYHESGSLLVWKVAG
jgi:SAM-dependent methyltransferase